MVTNFPLPSLDKGTQELTEEYIRLRAYQLFEERGCVHGYDLEDWLKAEAEVMGIHAAAQPTNTVKKKRAKAA